MTAFTTGRDLLVAALSHAGGITPRRSTIPILGCFLLETGDDGLRLTATDLHAFLIEQIDEEPRAPCRCCVPADRLQAFVGALSPGTSVQFTPGNNRLAVRSGRAQAALQTQPVEDYPRSPVAAEGTSFTTPAADLTAALRATAPAISTDGTRYYLNGVNLHENGTAVATDGHRLAIHHIAVDLPAIPGTIVPAATVARMLALLRGFSGDVTVSVYEARISFATERWTLTSKVIDGTFPNYSHLLLPRRKHPLVVDRAALVRAVRLVDGVTQDPVKPRGIILAATVEELEVASAADAACAASVSLPLSDQGEVARVGVKASYLLDALAGLSTPLVELHITTEPPWAPVWVRAPDSADGVAIMPVKI